MRIKKQANNCVCTFFKTSVHAILDLCCVEGGTQSANSLCVCLCLLVDLQQLSGLSQRLQHLLGAAVGQLPVCQPLLQLPHVVPEARNIKTSSSEPTAQQSHNVQPNISYHKYVTFCVTYIVCMTFYVVYIATLSVEPIVDNIYYFVAIHVKFILSTTTFQFKKNMSAGYPFNDYITLIK